jgi:hypothetical protein
MSSWWWIVFSIDRYRASQFPTSLFPMYSVWHRWEAAGKIMRARKSTCNGQLSLIVQHIFSHIFHSSKLFIKSPHLTCTRYLHLSEQNSGIFTSVFIFLNFQVNITIYNSKWHIDRNTCRPKKMLEILLSNNFRELRWIRQFKLRIRGEENDVLLFSSPIHTYWHIRFSFYSMINFNCLILMVSRCPAKLNT